MGLEVRDQRVLVPGLVVVRYNVHIVTKTVDVETLVGQPVFKCGEVFEEQFSRQRLVPAVVTGNVRGGIDTVGSGDQMTREYALRNIARSVCYGERQAYEQQGVEGVDRRRRYDLPIHREEILEIQRKSTLPPWKRVSGGIRSHNNMSFVGGDTGGKGSVTQWVHAEYMEGSETIRLTFTQWVRGGYFSKAPTKVPTR